MKKVLIVLVAILITVPAAASMFGEENILLAQILQQSIQELIQLKAMLKNGSDTLDLMKDINQGINDSISLYRTAFPNSDPGIYSEWQKVQDAIRGIEGIYGVVATSPNSAVERDTDHEVAEAVSLNNSIYDYTKKIDEIGEVIKNYSHQVSPGGAQKLTAQTLGVMLQVQNEQLRAQATGLKLQAQSMAVQNKKDKDLTRQVLDTSDSLSLAMKTDKVNFELPRF